MPPPPSCAARPDHDAGNTTLKLIGLDVPLVSIDAIEPLTRQCAATPMAASTHDGADTVTLRTGSPMAVVAMEAPSRSAVQSAAVSVLPWAVDDTLNSPSAGGVTRCSFGAGTCGIHPYGTRYARYTAFDAFAPLKSGYMYSQTIAPSLVTSNMRPPAPAVISVLPFGSRCAPLMFVLKNLGFV